MVVTIRLPNKQYPASRGAVSGGVFLKKVSLFFSFAGQRKIRWLRFLLIPYSGVYKYVTGTEYITSRTYLSGSSCAGAGAGAVGLQLHSSFRTIP